MNRSSILGACCAIVTSLLATTAQAAVMNPILSVNIGGTLYDVTFHDQPGDTFNELWNNDDDGAFDDNDGSLFNAAPTFWGDSDGALEAAIAIIAALGITGETTPGSDGFLVAHNKEPTTVKSPNLTVTVDGVTAPPTDNPATWVISPTETMAGYAFASFEVSAVPVPAAIWLFGSGLLGLIGVARRKKA
jgi:hypothetical protein